METTTALHKKETSVKALLLQSEEDRKNILILQESLEKLNEKIKMYKKQLEEQEQISNSNIMRVSNQKQNQTHIKYYPCPTLIILCFFYSPKIRLRNSKGNLKQLKVELKKQKVTWMFSDPGPEFMLRLSQKGKKARLKNVTISS